MCIGISEKFPLHVHGHSIKLRNGKDHRCLLRHFFLASDLIFSQYFNLLCLVSLYINHNSTCPCILPDWGQKAQHFEGLKAKMIEIETTCDQGKNYGQLTPLIQV